MNNLFSTDVGYEIKRYLLQGIFMVYAIDWLSNLTNSVAPYITSHSENKINLDNNKFTIFNRNFHFVAIFKISQSPHTKIVDS